jgi:hypothetical protein
VRRTVVIAPPAPGPTAATPVIASAAKQSSFSFDAARLDCFVAALLAMTARLSVLAMTARLRLRRKLRVIASAAKQSSFLSRTEELDCFVASLLAMTARRRALQ